MVGHHTRFRENGDLPQWLGSAAKKKPPFSNARALWWRVKLCAVGMRNAILGTDLNLLYTFRYDDHPIRLNQEFLNLTWTGGQSSSKLILEWLQFPSVSTMGSSARLPCLIWCLWSIGLWSHVPQSLVLRLRFSGFLNSSPNQLSTKNCSYYGCSVHLRPTVGFQEGCLLIR